METQFEEILENQKKSWNKFSPGWKKWDALTMNFLKSHGDAIIQLITPQKDNYILDVASGTGEPGLSMAARLDGGKVVLSDLSEGMLEVAKEKASHLGLSNIESVVTDAGNLPFKDETFDAVTCRLGFMFFPDLDATTKELKRVLKPGGKIAVTVWGAPEKNFWVTCMLENIRKHVEFPPPPEGAPGVFRCAGKGMMVNLFKSVGLSNIIERELPGKMNCYNAEEYWDMLIDVAAPFANVLNKTEDHILAKIKAGVVHDINEKYPVITSIDTGGLLVYGEK